MSIPMKSFISWIFLAPAVTLTIACGSDAPTTPHAADPSVVLGSVTVAPQAIVMAAGKTAQLTASATSLSGIAIDALDTVMYSSSDSGRVRVSPTGLLTAATGAAAVTSGPVSIIVSARKNGVTKTTTAYVAVVATEGTNPQFTIRTPNDTAILGVGTFQSVVGTLSYTVNGSTVNVPSSGIPFVIQVTPSAYGVVQGTKSFQVLRAVDTIRVSTSVSVFGTMLSDSTKYPLGDASAVYITIQASGLIYKQGDGSAPFDTSTTFYVRKGGSVWFQNNLFGSAYVFGVSFESSNGGVPIAPITGLSGDFSAFRHEVVLNTSGTYKYTWTGDATKLLPPNQIGSTIVVR
jgi:hypothetical protein